MVNKTSLNFIIPFGTAPFDIMFSFGQTDNDLDNILRKHLPEECHSDICELSYSPTGKGRIVMFKSNATCIRMRVIPKHADDFATLQHEIFHAVEFVYDKIGVTHSLSCGEVYAYAIENLTRQVYLKLGFK